MNTSVNNGDRQTETIVRDAKYMKRPFLIGERVYLRSLQESDLGEEYLRWLDDYEVTRFLEVGKFPSNSAMLGKYLERFQNSTAQLIFAIMDQETEAFIGTATLNLISWVHRTADTGLMIGNKDFWGKGYAVEVWSLVIDYAFQRLGLRRITAGTVVGNVASTVILKKLGFEVEGTLRRHWLVDGEYQDGILFGLFREEFYKNSKRLELE